MKNIPEKIYLQIGEYTGKPAFNELVRSEITWCDTKIFDNDIEYIHSADLMSLLLEFCKFHHKRFNLQNVEQARAQLIDTYIDYLTSTKQE